MRRHSVKWFAAALAVGVVLPARTPAAIVSTSSFGAVSVSGAAQQGPPNQAPTERHSYLDGPPPVQNLQPVHLTFSGNADVPMASASSSTTQDTLITFNPANDMLQVNASESVVVNTRVDPPTRTLVGNAHAEAQSAFNVRFSLTDRAYDYTITVGDFGLNTQGPVTTGHFADVDLVLNKNSPFEQFMFAQELLVDGTIRHAGSLSGTLAPGDYTFVVDLFGAIGQAGGHADGRVGAGLLLKAAPPEIKWANAAGGSFQTNTNWDPQRVPAAPERAAFELPGNYTVSLDQDATNDRLRANGAGVNVTFDLAGHSYTVDQLNIGGRPGDSGTFTIKDSGGIAVSALPPGGPRPAQTTPPVTFKALSMAVRGSETVEIAAATANNLAIIDEDGAVLASGADAQWTTSQLLVGATGSGVVTLANKASLASQFASIDSGTGQNSAGSVTVTGAGSKWTSDVVQVGPSHQGILKVENGAAVELKNLSVAANPQSTGTVIVDGRNSNILQPGAAVAVIGGDGDGRLSVVNGAQYFAPSGTLTIGSSRLATGQVNVAGASLLSVEALNVGPGGVGSLTVGQQGTVFVSSIGGSGAAVVGPFGSVTVGDAGAFFAHHSLQVDGEFHVRQLTGLAIVGDNTGSFALGNLFVNPNGTLSGTGTIFANVILNGGAPGFTGHMQPGDSPGTLTVAGGFEQRPGGVLDIQVAGTAPGQFDVLKIIADTDAGLAGDAAIAGDLALEFLDGFAPHAGDRFDFLTAAGSLTGQFAHVDVRGLAPGFQFDLRNEDGRYALIALNDGVAVPEPGAAAGLLLLGAASIVRRRRG